MGDTSSRHLGGFNTGSGWRRVGGSGKAPDKFIGPSGSPKPQPGSEIGHIPDGSTCLEEDTGVMFRWRGTSWFEQPSNKTDELLEVLINEIQGLRQDMSVLIDGVLSH